MMLVVRPHPSESHAPWQAAAAEAENVAVVAEGSVVPWLLAAKVVVHNGCTSAVEAAILGCPVVAFRPVVDPAYDLDLPNRLSRGCQTQGDVLAAVRAVLEGQGGFGPDPAVLAENVAGLDGPLACDRMLDAVEAGFDRFAPSAAPREGRRLKAWVRQRVEAIARQMPVTTRLQYVNHLLAEFNEEAVNGKVQALRRAFGRFDATTVSLRDGLVHIVPSRRGGVPA
jgi:hypothetical protein